MGDDHGAHGAFDEQAKDRSRHLWLTTHREWVYAAGLGLVGLAGAALLGRRR